MTNKSIHLKVMLTVTCNLSEYITRSTRSQSLVDIFKWVDTKHSNPIQSGKCVRMVNMKDFITLTAIIPNIVLQMTQSGGNIIEWHTHQYIKIYEQKSIGCHRKMCVGAAVHRCCGETQNPFHYGLFRIFRWSAYVFGRQWLCSIPRFSRIDCVLVCVYCTICRPSMRSVCSICNMLAWVKMGTFERTPRTNYRLVEWIGINLNRQLYVLIMCKTSDDMRQGWLRFTFILRGIVMTVTAIDLPSPYHCNTNVKNNNKKHSEQMQMKINIDWVQTMYSWSKIKLHFQVLIQQNKKLRQHSFLPNDFIIAI